MSFISILDGILLKPLMLLFEVVFISAARITENAGISIFLLSMAMNLLVLPLYRRTDILQEEERLIQEKMRDGIKHIKKTFKGDERMMILQTYYRQNHYKPTYALRGSLSLLLQIPFFIAAYRFLSNLDILNGISMGFIADLAKPDGAIKIAGIGINALPFIMTGINIISCIIYTKNSPVKTKLQLYGMAVFFLVFLYDSPAGLVFYWTLNNLFSLAKTIIYKLKNPKRVICGIASAVGIFLMIYAFAILRTEKLWVQAAIFLFGILMQLPTALYWLRKARPVQRTSVRPAEKYSSAAFFVGAVFMAVMTGAMIPSSVIKASPLDFVNINYFYNPIWYIVSALCYSIGTFIVWAGIFYKLASTKGRIWMERIVWLLCGSAAVTYLFFGREMGTISPALVYDNGWVLSAGEKLINLCAIAVVIILFLLIQRKWKKRTTEILAIGTAALICLSFVNMIGIANKIDAVNIHQEANENEAVFTLSKNGNNVVTIMLDRASSRYIPSILKEKPELRQMFSGFTFYPNAVSFGGHTNIAAPALWGGYEYTPAEMNKRETELLVDKHNEALKVLPVLFDQNGYDVTVCDPPLAGYMEVPDLSIYADYPNIKTHITIGRYTNNDLNEESIANSNRNFFCFSMTKCMPLFIQKEFYDYGQYNQSEFLIQVAFGNSTARGLTLHGVDSYNVLKSMRDITHISDGAENTYLMLSNNTTHEPMLYQTPDYVPSKNVDNTAYDLAHSDRFIVNGKMRAMPDPTSYQYYSATMAALLRLGEWMEYLKENDAYDNTRIVITADHGLFFSGDVLEGWRIPIGNEETIDTDLLHPLLMFKDFGSDGFAISDEFMTNADLPTLATANLLTDARNPFTGNKISSDRKTAQKQYLSFSHSYQTDANNGYKFLPGTWFAVESNSDGIVNWTYISNATDDPCDD